MIDDRSAKAMEMMVLANWARYEEEAFWKSLKIPLFKKTETTAGQLIDPYLDKLTVEFLKEIDMEELIIYPPEIKKLDFKALDLPDFYLETRKFIEFTIYRYYFENENVTVIPPDLIGVYINSG